MDNNYKNAVSRSRKATPLLKATDRGHWLRELRAAVGRGVARSPWPRRKKF